MTTVENVFWVKTIFFTRHVIYFPHEIWKAQTVSVMHLHTAPTGSLSFVHLLIYCNTVLIWVAHLAICATELASCCDHKATDHKTPHLLFPWKHQNTWPSFTTNRPALRCFFMSSCRTRPALLLMQCTETFMRPEMYSYVAASVAENCASFIISTVH